MFGLYTLCSPNFMPSCVRPWTFIYVCEFVREKVCFYVLPCVCLCVHVCVWVWADDFFLELHLCWRTHLAARVEMSYFRRTKGVCTRRQTVVIPKSSETRTAIPTDSDRLRTSAWRGQPRSSHNYWRVKIIASSPVRVRYMEPNSKRQTLSWFSPPCPLQAVSENV